MPRGNYSAGRKAGFRGEEGIFGVKTGARERWFDSLTGWSAFALRFRGVKTFFRENIFLVDSDKKREFSPDF